MHDRTPHLIVRLHVPGRATLVWAAVVIGGALALWGAFEAGRSVAGYSIVAGLAARQAAAREHGELTARLRDAETRLADSEVARRVDREAYAQLGKSIAELQSRRGEQAQELAFYRGIVSPAAGIGGLRIQRLQILPGIAALRYRVRLVLVQAAAKDGVVSASADFSVDGTRAGQAASLPLTEIGISTRLLSFSFRYFQEVETEIELPADFVPRAVQIEVRPGKGAAPLRASYPWTIDTT